MTTQYDAGEIHPSYRSAPLRNDDRTPLALAAGLIAALVAGCLWGVIVHWTHTEIGYAAWGVGLLVGVAMANFTSNRSLALGCAAAVLAVLGLATGKAITFVTAGSAIAAEVEANDDFLSGAIAWQLYEDRALDEETLQAIDAAGEAGDTISDALWADMQTQANSRLAQMSADEKSEVAALFAGTVIGSTGILQGIIGQLSGFDLLWLFLAVGTAFKMMAAGKEETETAAAQ